MDTCLPIVHLIDAKRSIPNAIKQVEDLLGISCAFEQAVQRLLTSVSMVSKGMLKEHLLLLANSMTCAGTLVGFNQAGIKALSKTLNFQVPFSEATLYTPKRCFEKAAEKCHADSLSSIVAACSWGKPVAVGTGSRFDILWDTREVELNQKDGIDVYNFLHLVRGGTEEKADSGCLGGEVDSFKMDGDYMETGSPEHDSGAPKPVFEDGLELNLDDIPDNGTSGGGWGAAVESTPAESGGWGSATKSTPTERGGWGAATKSTPTIESGGWGAAANTTPAAETGGWGAAAKTTAAAESGGWGAAPKTTAVAESGGWGAPKTTPAAESGGWGAASNATPAAESGGWGAAPKPTPAAESGGWGTTPKSTPVAESGGWGAAAVKTTPPTEGGWGKKNVEPVTESGWGGTKAAEPSGSSWGKKDVKGDEAPSWGSKKPETESGPTWGRKNTEPNNGSGSGSGSSWGKNADKPDSRAPWGQKDFKADEPAWKKPSQPEGQETGGWGAKKTDNTGSGSWGKKDDRPSWKKPDAVPTESSNPWGKLVQKTDTVPKWGSAEPEKVQEGSDWSKKVEEKTESKDGNGWGGCWEFKR